MRPAVSILMPLYNGERYIGEAIQSVLSQSFSDWELIVQDDCSTDGGLDVVKQHKDARIIYGANAHNLHIAGTLNAAFARANGQYVQLLGQDDRLLPDCLATHVRFMETHTKPGFSFCPPFVIDAAGQRMMEASHAWDEQYENTDEVCDPSVALLLLFNYGCLPGSISTVMIRRNHLEMVGGFDSSYRICLDWNLWIRLARIFGFGFVMDRLVEIRSHLDQESRNPNRMRDRITETFRCLALLEDSLDPSLEPALRWGRKRRYAAEFMHQVYWALMHGQVQEAIDLFRMIQAYDGTIIPLGFWMWDLRRRLVRKLSGKGNIEIRMAFNSKWLRAQIRGFQGCCNKARLPPGSDRDQRFEGGKFGNRRWN